MGHIVCVTNQKGGVGKTTTAVNFSTALAVSEKNSLLVDCDPSGNATSGIGIDKGKLTKTLYHGMLGNATAEELLIDSDLRFLKTIPARVELFRAETELVSQRGKEERLRNLLGGLKEKFDYIVIDSPPSLSLLTVNAITAADSLLIPLQCEYNAIDGMGQMLKTVQILRKRFNPEMRVIGILLTMYEKKEKVCTQIAKEARTYFKEMVFKTVIPRTVGLRESASQGKPILLQDASSVGARAYLRVAGEFMERIAPVTIADGL